MRYRKEIGIYVTFMKRKPTIGGRFSKVVLSVGHMHSRSPILKQSLVGQGRLSFRKRWFRMHVKFGLDLCLTLGSLVSCHWSFLFFGLVCMLSIPNAFDPLQRNSRFERDILCQGLKGGGGQGTQKIIEDSLVWGHMHLGLLFLKQRLVSQGKRKLALT